MTICNFVLFCFLWNSKDDYLCHEFAILGGKDMLRTITQGSAILIQGIFVRSLPDGRIVIKLDDRTYAGLPVTKAA